MSDSSQVSMRRGFEIIDHLSNSPEGLGFGEIKELLGGVAPSTVSRVLKVLLDTDWVVKSPTGKYLIGNELHGICRRVLGERSVAEIAEPMVDELADECGESAAYAEFMNFGFGFKVKSERAGSYHYIDLFNENRSPSNGFFKLCLAFSGDEHIKQLLENNGHAELIKGFMDEVAVIREQGYYVSHENIGTRVIYPVFKKGVFCGALGISSVLRELSAGVIEEYKNKVDKVAGQLTNLIDKGV